MMEPLRPEVKGQGKKVNREGVGVHGTLPHGVITERSKHQKADSSGSEEGQLDVCVVTDRGTARVEAS